MQVVTTQLPKTTCDLKNIMVNGGFSDPEQCNCRQEPCSVKATDLLCIQKNRECQKERKEKLEKLGKASPLHQFFKKLLSVIDTLENDVELLFSEVERTRKEKDFAVDALNRTIKSFRVVEQESKLANQSQNNQQRIMQREICIHENFKINAGSLDLTVQEISFSSKLPVVDNIELIAKVKELSSGRVQDVPFVYQFSDPNSSMEAASQKILFSMFCQSLRKRRSVDVDVGFDDPLAFTSWDTRQNSTIAEKACMTFKTTVDYIDSLIEELLNLLIKSQKVLKISKSVSSDVNELKRQLNGSTDVYVSQEKMLSSISLEISGFQNRSNVSNLYMTWREKGEIFTSENNFTVCFGMDDCIATALFSLENLPLVSPEQIAKYKSALLKLKELLNGLLNYDKTTATNGNLTEIARATGDLLRTLNDTSLHCSKAPVLKPTQQSEFFIHSGKKMKIECGEVESALPVKYNWKLHDRFIDGAFKNNLVIKEASLDKAGVYTCVVTSPFGQISSDGVLVNVFEPPTFVSEPEDEMVTTLSESNNASFVCEVKGYPTPNITWYYQSFFDKKELNLQTDDPVLIIDNVTKVDSGFYFCRAKNSYGVAKSRLSKLDVLVSELPKQFIEMSVVIVDKENLVNTNSTINSTGIYEEIAGLLRVSDLQNVTFSVVPSEQSTETLHFRIESLFLINATDAVSMKDLLKISTQSRQNLANSAAKLVNMVLSNQSKIFLNAYDVILTVDNTSVSYKATLDQCKPGYQMRQNGIVCGKKFFIFLFF